MLDTFKRGDYMFWSVCSQAGSKATIVLKDDSKVYFTVNKSTADWHLLKLAQDSADYTGGRNLRIEIEVYDHPDLDIKGSINAYNITTDKGSTVGYGYNICIEDYKDEDFNDYFISIVAWNKKG